MVRADEKLTALLELEGAICAGLLTEEIWRDLARLDFIRPQHLTRERKATVGCRCKHSWTSFAVGRWRHRRHLEGQEAVLDEVIVPTHFRVAVPHFSVW